MPGGTDRLIVRILLLFLSGRGAGFRKVSGAGCWVVFGTLLGPEATGPGRVSFSGLFVSGFLVGPITHVVLLPFGGGVCGVCGMGLLFENYIVDASIFYKKQFPRI